MAHKLIETIKKCANNIYGDLEDMYDALEELVADESLDIYTKNALEECLDVLITTEYLDELIARLGCININKIK